MSDSQTPSQNPIIVYGAEWCAFCHVAMKYLDDKSIKYEYRDVDSNEDWLKEAMSKSGQTGIPVITIKDSVIVGFDRPKIDAALAA